MGSNSPCQNFLPGIDCKVLYQLIRGAILACLLPFFLSSCSTGGRKPVDLGRWDRAKIEWLQERAGHIAKPGRKVAFISAAFKETPYLAGSLIGSAKSSEKLVLRLDGIDCFTFLDYVEALRRSHSFPGLKKNLRQVRYRSGQVSFLSRNHFFSEWGAANHFWIRNVTAQIGGTKIQHIEKQLNRKEDGSCYLPGYPVKKWPLVFIPPEAIDATMAARLHKGDYIGIYSPQAGLDVSHTGIIVRSAGKIFFRHASSRTALRKIADEELLPYLGGKKGLVVYRPIKKQ